MYGWRVRIGLMTQVCENVEHAFHVYAPAGVTVCSMKFALPGETDEPRAFLLGELERLSQTCRGYKLDLIIIGTGEGSLILDREFDGACARTVERLTGVSTVTEADAVKEAFHALGLKNAAVLTAYSEGRTRAEQAFLESLGINVVRCGRMDLDIFNTHPYRQEAASDRTIYTQAVESDFSGADVFFLSGMGLTSMEIIPQLETDLGMPVITTHQAMLWSALRRCRVNGVVPGLGRLFLL